MNEQIIDTQEAYQNITFLPKEVPFYKPGNVLIGWNTYENRFSKTPQYKLGQKIVGGFPSDQTLFACWKEIRYDLNLYSNEPGIAVQSGNYLSGDVIEISAIPVIKHAKLSAWSDGNTNPVRQITIDGNKTLSAFFDFNDITITYVPGFE